jgi:hypothetical protein
MPGEDIMPFTNLQDFPRLYADLVQKVWSDDALLKKLENDPATTLAAAGIYTSAGATINIILRKLDRNAKLADQVAAWEEGEKTGVYDIIVPIKPEGGAALIPEGRDGCCCCPCTCT